MLHESFTRDIQGGSGLIQNEHRGVSNECASERQKLTLSGRQSTTALVHIGVVAFGQTHDEIMRAHSTRCSFDVLLRRPRFT